MNVYSRARLIMLPFKAINGALPEKGLIYEIGSGFGVLAAYLAFCAPQRQVVGIDFDKEKIKTAKSEWKDTNISFVWADALTYPYKQFQGAILSDFLHHLEYTSQEEILKRLAKKVAKRGTVIIKEIDKNDGIFTLCSRLWDYLFYPHDKIYYRSKQELSQLLSTLGFIVKVKRQVRWFPGSTYVFICKKV